MSRNKLFGTVPATFERLINLVELDLSANQLTGRLPDVGHWVNLARLALDQNRFQDKVPDCLNSLVNLTYAVPNGNAIPLFRAHVLAPDVRRSINFARNGFFGTLPDLHGLNNLQYLNVSDNDLIGEIPASFQSLRLLT